MIKPFIDLHCHLDGAVTVEIAKRLADMQQIPLESITDGELEKQLSVGNDCSSLTEFLKCFSLPLSLMQTARGLEEAAFLVAENKRHEGLSYLELRFAPQLHLEKGMSQEDAVRAVLTGAGRSGLHVNVILCCMRMENNHEANMETVRLAKKYLVKDGGVVALDLAGAEGLFSTSLFEKEFCVAEKLCVPFTIHAGEASGSESVWTALKFGAVRIGHGVRAAEDEKLLEYLAEKGIPLELCPTSNRITRAAVNMSLYPVRDFLKRGIKVTINTDDPAICRTDLAGEFEYLERDFDFSENEQKRMLLNAIDAAFTTDDVKSSLRLLLSC